MKIFLIGPPGSGKTTVNLHISQRLNINYISYRQIVLDFLNEKNKKSEMLKKLWLSFKPFPPLDAFEILKNQLSQKGYKNYALDGFPKRTNLLKCACTELAEVLPLKDLFCNHKLEFLI